MVNPHGNGCPEPEVLAAYLDHRLSLAERARVEEHLASCQQCIALVAGAARTVADLSAYVPDDGVTAEAPPLIRRRTLAAALATAAAVIAILAAPRLVGPWLGRDSGLVSLVDRVGEQRSVLGRLTGGFPHAPLGAPSAGGQDGRTAGSDRVLLTSGKIRESFGGHPAPSQLHALGVSQLLAASYDDAAQSLLAASREQPANGRYSSDLAAVQLERARLGVRADDLPRALAAADHAVRLDPSLREAWFNRALALGALSLRDEAKSSWTEYLKRDSASPWAAEARSRLAELEKPTIASAWTAMEGRLQAAFDASTADEAVRAQTTEARNFIEARLIADWAGTVVAGGDASAELGRLRLMADAMLRIASDALYRDVVASIDRAEASGAAAVRALAAAHDAYAEAAIAFAADRFAEAGKKLAMAQSQLQAAGSPFVHRAAVDIAGTTIVRGDYAATLSAVGAAKAAGHIKGYAYVAARASWFEGLVAFAQRRIGDTQAHYEDTLSTFERMGDDEQVALAHNLLASLFYYLGDRPNEWRHREGALRGLSVSRSARYRSLILTAAGLSLREDNPNAALALYDAALIAARESGREIFVLEVLPQRALAHLALRHDRDAAADLTAARQALASVSEPRLKEAYELSILSSEGEWQRRQDAAQAATTAMRALDLIRQRNDPADGIRVPAFQLQLAKAHLVQGKRSEAKVALADGIRAFDRLRTTLTDEGRLPVFERSWQLFEVAVHLAIADQDYSRAFEMSERARMRTLAEARRAPAPRSLSDVQASLASDEAIVALNQFDDELAILVIRKGTVGVQTRPMRREDAARLVSRQQEEIWREGPPAASRDLYNEVIRPVADRLAGAASIVFVPDATYQDVSFVALWDTSRQRFLVESVTVSLAPTVEAYISVSRNQDARIVQAPLIVGGASRQADAEALSVAAVYPASSIVTGMNATRERFFADAPAHAVVHLSADTAASMSNPLLSKVVLADRPGARYSGTVLGTDIASRAMPQTRLVVLDEVESTSSERGEGTLSLARAFLTAGVPAVIGTLPGANETATQDLMIAFHRAMSKGMTAAQALQTVQRNALQQTGRRLGAWSALVLYGSDR